MLKKITALGLCLLLSFVAEKQVSAEYHTFSSTTTNLYTQMSNSGGEAYDYLNIYGWCLEEINSPEYFQQGMTYNFAQYTLFDLFDDGIKELFVNVHTAKFGGKMYVYRYDGNRAYLSDTISCNFYLDEVLQFYADGLIMPYSARGHSALDYYQFVRGGTGYEENYYSADGGANWKSDYSSWALPDVSAFFDAAMIEEAPPLIDITDFTYLTGTRDNNAQFYSENSSYEVIVKDCTWTQAWQECKNKGGHLVRIESAEEFDRVVSLLESNSAWQNKVFFLGGQRNLDSQEYYWLDDNGKLTGFPLNSETSWAYSYWGYGEPTFAYGSDVEYCMTLFKYQGRWILNDDPDNPINTAPEYSGYVGYICEYENQNYAVG